MKKHLFSFLILILLTGCLQERIIDDINLLSAFGYDVSEGGKIKGTGIIPVYRADKSIDNESFTAIGNQSKDIIKLMQQKSADPIENGSVEIILFGKEMAEKGVIEVIDTLERDARIGSNIALAVVDGTANEVLIKDLGNRGTGTYLSTLIEHNMKNRNLPLINLHLFLNAYYSKVKDPFLPYIELEDNKVRVKGLALLQEDKVVSYVDNADMFFFKTLMENFKNGSHSIKVEDEYVTTFILTLSRDYKIESALSDPVVYLDLKMEGHIREFSGKILDPKMIKKIEKKYQTIINEKCEKLLTRFSDENIDPIGVGLMAKTQTRKFDIEKWKESYPKTTFRVSSKVTISETGAIE
ncbi:Ger(x)C family spore germination protein [Bacillus sp. DJP31]|uniref:Ger(x)C family spore germination protein n=1 Tax=Bacillus sp. DJP31 TaxID=3409789 RepID=UPI003BB67A50